MFSELTLWCDAVCAILQIILKMALMQESVFKARCTAGLDKHVNITPYLFNMALSPWTHVVCTNTYKRWLVLCNSTLVQPSFAILLWPFADNKTCIWLLLTAVLACRIQFSLDWVHIASSSMTNSYMKVAWVQPKRFYCSYVLHHIWFNYWLC